MHGNSNILVKLQRAITSSNNGTHISLLSSIFNKYFENSSDDPFSIKATSGIMSCDGRTWKSKDVEIFGQEFVAVYLNCLRKTMIPSARAGI